MRRRERNHLRGNLVRFKTRVPSIEGTLEECRCQKIKPPRASRIYQDMRAEDLFLFDTATASVCALAIRAARSVKTGKPKPGIGFARIAIDRATRVFETRAASRGPIERVALGSTVRDSRSRVERSRRRAEYSASTREDFFPFVPAWPRQRIVVVAAAGREPTHTARALSAHRAREAARRSFPDGPVGAPSPPPPDRTLLRYVPARRGVERPPVAAARGGGG
jgi:hypothetical protein